MKHLGLIFLVIFFEVSNAFGQIDDQNHIINFPENEWKLVDNVSDFGWSNERLRIVREYFDFFGSQSLMIIENGNLVVLFNGFQKKTQKAPKKEIEKAVQIMKEYLDYIKKVDKK